MLEAGAVASKNTVNIMVKNVVDVVFGGMTYWMFGYALSFGDGPYSNPFCGMGGLSLCVGCFRDCFRDRPYFAPCVGWVVVVVVVVVVVCVCVGCFGDRPYFAPCVGWVVVFVVVVGHEKCSPSPSRLEVLLSDVFVNYFVDQRDCFCLCVTIVCVMIRPSHRCSFCLGQCRIL